MKFYARSSRFENKSAWNAYYTDYLEPKAKHWPRTILTATLWFLLEELGIKTIFFHTHESGMRLKQIKFSAPPRSIYTDLPRLFCFRTTHNGPRFCGIPTIRTSRRCSRIRKLHGTCTAFRNRTHRRLTR